MKKWLALFLFFVFQAHAQQTVVQTPLPGWLWTYYGPTIGADWGPPVAGNFVSVPDNAALKTIVTTNSFVLRETFSTAIQAPPLFYSASPGACSLNSGLGDDGSQVRRIDGTCWIAQFPSSGVDFREFGADPTGASDARPAINAAFALGSNHTFICNGTFTIKSLAASPYAPVAGPIGLKLTGTDSVHLVNVKVKGQGCIITADNSSNNSNWWHIDFIDGLEIDSVTFLANKTGLVTASPSMIILYHLHGFSVHDVRVSGDWGGEGPLDPTFVRGDWLINGKFDHVDLPQVGQCYDLAFIRGVSFTNSQYVGAGAVGGGSALPCISIAYDSAMQTAFPYAFFRSTDNSISGNDISNFGQGLLIRAGQRYQITGNSFHGNPGSLDGLGFYPRGVGILVKYESNACCDSAFDPVIDVTMTGNVFSRNGEVTIGGGVMLDTTLSSAINFSDFTIVGNYFSNNTDTGIRAPTSNFLVNVATANNGFSGSFQTALVGTNIVKAGHPPPQWLPSDASGAGLSFTAVTAQYALNDTKVSYSFALTWPVTANGANAVIQGLPYFAGNSTYAYTSALCFSTVNLGFPLLARVLQNDQRVGFYNGSTGANVTNAQLSGDAIQCAATYPAL